MFAWLILSVFVLAVGGAICWCLKEFGLTCEAIQEYSEEREQW